ncbi:MAG: hypothetical protein N3G80_01485 [Candidatus Micrarchaeota archaeon]|nr:hypothetical protein [Candidatus Micrarchaeota archaeon]
MVYQHIDFLKSMNCVDKDNRINGGRQAGIALERRIEKMKNKAMQNIRNVQI